ncbi:uncharacterized protein LOC105712005 [Aotus nancymaae]|uniref:uncharacterized protein LOC105712005 n=1 Tax=Aotus nancymaae TaxID=37293 RepID=UPI0030FEC32D
MDDCLSFVGPLLKSWNWLYTIIPKSSKLTVRESNLKGLLNSHLLKICTIAAFFQFPGIYSALLDFSETISFRSLETSPWACGMESWTSPYCERPNFQRLHQMKGSLYRLQTCQLVKEADRAVYHKLQSMYLC